MAKKINQRLLNEELKKFRILSEYSFYTEEPKKDDDLILGANVDEADEVPGDEAPADTAADAPVDDSKTAANAAAAGTEGGDEAPAETGDEAGDETPVDTPDETGGDDMDFSAGGDEAPADDMGADTGDEVEVDVTQLVKGTEDAKKSAELSFVKSSELLDKFSELERRVAAMDSIAGKIDTLEKEIVKRNPTPVEKLEMRSLSSFPYNVKLTDYWKDVEGYQATGGEQEPKEYVLTQDDVDSGYTDASIKNSFNVPEDYEEDDYEEENI